MRDHTRQLIELALAGDNSIATDTTRAIRRVLDGKLPAHESRAVLAQPAEPTRLSFTVAETAELLGISYMSCYRLIRRGLLRSNRALRQHIISRSAIEEFLASDTV